MEPKLPTPENNGAQIPQNADRLPAVGGDNLRVPTPDALPLPQHEKESVNPEKQTAAPPAIVPPAQIQDNTSTVTPVAPMAQPVADDANPAVANDDDLIEKEWVDRVKKTIKLTRDDPYEQERQVGKLKHDYVGKRYGKDIKIADE